MCINKLRKLSEVQILYDGLVGTVVGLPTFIQRRGLPTHDGRMDQELLKDWKNRVKYTFSLSKQYFGKQK